jgi:hypothetical protein
LPFAASATILEPMFLSRSSRRLIAQIAVVLLVACHAVAIARASVANAPHSSTGAATAPCHDGGQDDPGAGLAQCDTALSLASKTSSLDYRAVDSPALTVYVDRLSAASDLSPPAERRLPRIEPPPLTILYCCLRN